MPEFLVRITLDASAVPAERAEGLLAAERAEAEELKRSGVVVAMWRVAGEPSTVSIWRAEDERGLRSALARLPLAAWMTVEAEPLEPHYLFAAD